MPATLSDHDLLARLVAFESTSARSNEPIAGWLAEYLDGPGVRLTELPGDGPGKVNLVAEAGPPPGAGREGIVLSGHLDVVPADEPAWTSNPFTLRETDDAWYGRGTCDMKGFIALAANLFRGAAAETPSPLALVLSSDEEVGSRGVQRLAASWGTRPPLPRAVVIGEPTSLRCVRMHKGHLTLRITVPGQSAHSGSPHLGRNAIEPAAEIVRSLRAWRGTLAASRDETSVFFPDVPFPVLNVARIRGGDALNVVPASCVVEIGLRLLPGQASTPFVRDLRGIVAGVDADAALEILNDNPPMLTDADSSIARRLASLLEQTESYGVSFASDGGVLTRDLGHECVLFGPGSIEHAHRPNEFVPRAEMAAARDRLASLLRQGAVA